MAWVTLHDLLSPNLNLYGIVPLDATITLISGSDDESSFFRYEYKKNDYIEEMIRLDKTKMSIRDFIDKFAILAKSTEWGVSKNGSLIHHSDGLYRVKDGKLVSFEVNGGQIVFLTYCQLDLTEWLKEQPDDILAQFMKHSFGWRREYKELANNLCNKLARQINLLQGRYE
jgi:hypothetical protein